MRIPLRLRAKYAASDAYWHVVVPTIQYLFYWCDARGLPGRRLRMLIWRHL
jgi:hypothetical protein